jgi:Toprim domain
MSAPAIAYATLARLRAGARNEIADVICPVCSVTRTGAAAKRRVLRTWAKESGIGFHCVRCDIDGVAKVDDEATEVAAIHVEVDGAEEERKRRNQEGADRIWRQAYNIAGTAGEAYLARRGIALADVPNFGGLRWHPNCPWEDGTAPCVLARFTDAITGEPRGIWRRPINGAKPKTLGPMGGCVIRLWPDEDVSCGLVLGEGVETTLAAATRFVHRNTLLRPAWAAGSAGNLEDFPVIAGIAALTLLVDHDANGRGQEAARGCGERWRDANREVTLLTPRPVGADFNDLVRP